MKHARLWQNTFRLLFFVLLMTSCASGPVGETRPDVPALSPTVSTPPVVPCTSFLPSAPCSQYVKHFGDIRRRHPALGGGRRAESGTVFRQRGASVRGENPVQSDQWTGDHHSEHPHTRQTRGWSNGLRRRVFCSGAMGHAIPQSPHRNVVREGHSDLDGWSGHAQL